MSEERHNLFIPGKRKYVIGDRPAVDCILCSALNKDPKVTSLIVYKNDFIAVSANLFPYNPGHLMALPIRHITDIRQLTQQEAEAMHKISCRCMDILGDIYNSQGFNVGYNVGPCSGASIEHLHLHIVPRYKSELGFLDIVTGDRVIVEDPRETIKKIKESFHS